jgi:dephospho-CoA kinase
MGLTGGIGSGKSTVGGLFEELGVPVYYSDLRGRELMCGSGEIQCSIVRLLGSGAYRGDVPDTAYIARRVFADPMLLASLNSIIHPAVALDFESWTLSLTDRPYVLLESAILFESGFDRLVDRVVTVSAPEQMRLERVLARGHGGVSREDIMRRMANQLTDTERSRRAWRTMENNGTLADLARQVRQIDKEIKNVNQ